MKATYEHFVKPKHPGSLKPVALSFAKKQIPVEQKKMGAEKTEIEQDQYHGTSYTLPM